MVWHAAFTKRMPTYKMFCSVMTAMADDLD